MNCRIQVVLSQQLIFKSSTKNRNLFEKELEKRSIKILLVSFDWKHSEKLSVGRFMATFGFNLI